MQSFKKRILGLAALITTSVSFCIPVMPVQISQHLYVYHYGWPIHWIHIYQINKSGVGFLGSNFFCGHSGLAVDLLSLLIDILMIFYVLRFITVRLGSRRDRYNCTLSDNNGHRIE